MNIKKFIFILVLIIIAYCLCSAAQTAYYIHIGRSQAAATRSFNQTNLNATLKILIMGDSSAVGVGAISPTGSVAGLIAQDFPDAHIDNLAVSGMRTEGLVKSFDQVAGQKYDLIIIHIGGNDIVRFVDIEESVNNLRLILNKSAAVGENTVLITAGNMESVKMFPWPVRKIYGAHSRLYRDKFMQVANEMNIHYVDLYRTKDSDPYYINPSLYYSRDLLHPSEAGYAVWYERIGPIVDSLLR